MTEVFPWMAQAQPPSGGGAQIIAQILPLAIIFVIFYFILIRPARKRQKTLDEMVANLKSGDRVLTTGGLYGTVVAVDDTRVQLRIADQVKVDVAKSAIAGLDTPRQ